MAAPALGDRRLFPDLAAFAYLNHAGISPPSLRVRQAAAGLLDDYAARGAVAFPAWMAQRNRLRGKLATLIGCEARDIGFVPNTTQGVIDVALCFPWQRGDRVLVFEGEFPANVTPWQRAANLFGLDVVAVPLTPFGDGTGLGLQRLEEALRRGVRLCAVSAVQFRTGLRMPLGSIRDLCRAYGAELFVDAVQACGVVPVDVTSGGYDYLACGSHKWMMGVEGAGFLYVHPDRVGALRPNVAGWLSHEDSVAFLIQGEGHLRYDRPIRRRADFVEGGNYNSLGFAALEASLDVLLEVGGPQAILGHVTAYLDALEPALLARGFRSLRLADPEARSGSLCVLPPVGVDVVALHAALGERGVSAAIPDGVLRLSPHWPNALTEVPRVVDAVEDATRAVAR